MPAILTLCTVNDDTQMHMKHNCMPQELSQKNIPSRRSRSRTLLQSQQFSSLLSQLLSLPFFPNINAFLTYNRHFLSFFLSSFFLGIFIWVVLEALCMNSFVLVFHSIKCLQIHPWCYISFMCCICMLLYIWQGFQVGLLWMILLWNSLPVSPAQRWCISVGIFLGVGLLSQMICMCSTSVENAKMHSKWSYQFTPLAVTYENSYFYWSQRKAIPKNAQTTTQLHSSHMLVK